MSGRWARVDDLFARAMDEPPHRWDAFLAEACEDPEVRAEVRRLLEADRASEGFLEGQLDTSVLGAWGEALSAASEEHVSEFDRSGERVGAYRLLRRVARGGMASVYLAQREDGGWRQRVAVKVIRHGLDTEDVIARFRFERQILSTLTHPNIARLLDGGATDDGHPYLVMEYVEGRPVTTYSDEGRLSIEDRLRLFVQIGGGVARAHRSLVIHRDIKPSNILVTDDGTAKLLDFGIAKLLDADQWPGTAHLTRTGLRIMTPEYASPEQLAGAPVTTASDVFQLGVLLYRLLTGCSPFSSDSDEAGSGPTRRSGTTVLRPSTVLRRTDATRLTEISANRDTSPAALTRKLTGDLERIVLKAMDEDPERRYDSAEAMVDDVRRYLSGHPIEARPASHLYRMRRFLGRHRWLAPTLAAGLVVGVGYVTTLVRHNAALERERNTAQMEARTAQAVTDFLVGLFGSTDPFEGGRANMPAREILGRGAEQVLDRTWEDAEVRTRLVESVARAYHDLDLHPEAVDFLRAAVPIAANGGSGGSIPPDLLTLRSLLGFSLIESGEHQEGVDVLQGTISARRSSGDTLSTEHIRDLMAISTAHFLEGDGEEGLRVTEVWMRHVETLEDDPDNLALAALDRTFHQAMSPLSFERAEALALQQVTLARALYPDATPAVAHAYEDLASIRVRNGRYEDALEPSQRAAALTAAMFGDHHLTTSYATGTLASIYLSLGRADEALALQQEVVDIRVEALGDDHMIIPMSRFKLAQALRGVGRLQEADAELDWAIDRTAAEFGTESRMTAVMVEELGRVRIDQGRLGDAERLLEEAGARYDVIYEPTDQRRVMWGLAMADLRLRQGRPDEARAILEGAAEALQKAGMSEHELHRRVSAALADVLSG